MLLYFVESFRSHVTGNILKSIVESGRQVINSCTLFAPCFDKSALKKPFQHPFTFRCAFLDSLCNVVGIDSSLPKESIQNNQLIQDKRPTRFILFVNKRCKFK